jgi:hypothetical protein
MRTHHYLVLCGVDCDTKKDAWRVWYRRWIARVSTPGCRFCDSAKLYLETATEASQKKGFLQNDHHAS